MWALVSFGAKPYDSLPIDSLPVDIISTTEFTQLTAGSKNAPKAAEPKQLVEKIAPPKPADNPAQKVVEKPEIMTASALAPEAQPEPKPRDAEKKPEHKPDPIAEALKKTEAKKPEPKKEEPKIAQPQKKPAPPQPKFDPAKIEQKLALLDKRAPQRMAAAGDVLSTTATL